MASPLPSYFEQRVAALGLRAALEKVETDYSLTLRLRPPTPASVGVVLYLFDETAGTVSLDDPACPPAEVGEDEATDRRAIDDFLSIAVEGRVTAFHLGPGGCVEIDVAGTATRYWHKVLPVPGWRRRAACVTYLPYAGVHTHELA